MEPAHRALYGTHERSTPQKAFLLIVHAIAVGIVVWLLGLGGLTQLHHAGLLGWVVAGDPERRAWLIVCSGVYFARLVLGWFVFVRRRMPWSEALTVAPWLWVLQLTLAVAGGTNTQPLGGLAVVGAVFYLVGSTFNTGAEATRHRWKKRPENKGRLYTAGFFRVCMHPNYFGDVLLFTGFALITGRAWTLVFPLVMASLFVFGNIPMLDAHLAERYGGEFAAYAQRTKRLIPFVY